MPNPRFLLAAALVLQCARAAVAADVAPADDRPTLFAVATAHLDTQWNWTIQDTIGEHLPKTLARNFDLFEKQPGYVFNFEGSFRYGLVKEYYPREWERLVAHARAGRWHASGSSVDAGDVNIPAPESLIRHALLANRFYRTELGQECRDLFLPDCFGFGQALPTVAAHCGLIGFSTQKLRWGSSAGIPFDVGRWEGVDGRAIVAALDPGSYTTTVRDDLSRSEGWLARAKATGEACGRGVAYAYFGTGDTGGAPDAESVRRVMAATRSDGPLRVACAPSDALYASLSDEEIARLPRWSSELLLSNHGTGAYTSLGAMKRLNRRNEQLAAAAERAALAADWFGALPYPSERLRQDWTRFLWHHHHDDVTGTSTPRAYPFSFNDEYLAQKDFAAVLGASVGAVAQALDTSVTGVPLVVFNPLAVEREDVVEARIAVTGPMPAHVRVFGPDGAEVLSQELERSRDALEILVLARMPPLGFAVYDVRASDVPCPYGGSMSVSDLALGNGRLRVTLAPAGDVAQVEDVATGRKAFASPVELQLLDDRPTSWPKWEVAWDDVRRAPRALVSTPTRTRIVERGPVRVAIEVAREAGGSWFTQTVRLASAGAGQVVEVAADVDWRMDATMLMAAFPLAAGAPTATYDLGLGTIARGNDTEKLHVVPAQQWADVSAADGSRGVAILSDCKVGWDKPGDGMLRLSLLRSPPGVVMDHGSHRFRYGIVTHAGGWREGVQELGERFNAPLVAFQARRHEGALGSSFSLMSIDSAQVGLSALKRAEDGGATIVRLVERHGRPAKDVRLHLPARVVSARDVTGQETAAAPAGELAVVDGDVVLSLERYQPRTLALELEPPAAALACRLPTSSVVVLPFDVDVASADGESKGGDFDGAGHAVPAELLPKEILRDGIRFVLGSASRGAKNAVACRGQALALPDGGDTAYLLAASSGGPVEAAFRVEDAVTTTRVASWSGWMGQAQTLVVDGRIVAPDDADEPFVDPADVAWTFTHRHDARGANEPYVFCYLHLLRLALPPEGTQPRRLVLPDDSRIKILAASVGTSSADDVLPATQEVDEVLVPRIRPKGEVFIRSVAMTATVDRPGAVLRYTLDGRLPTTRDPALTSSVTIAQDAALRVRAFVGTRPVGQVASRRVRIVAPRAALPRPERLAPGLDVECFEGAWERLPDFVGLEPKRRSVAATISLEPRTREEDYALRFTGYIEVPAEGVYTLALTTDDGSRLHVDGEPLVDSDGLHVARRDSAPVALAAGLHAVTIEMFQHLGDAALEASWALRGEAEAAIPATALWHEAKR